MTDLDLLAWQNVTADSVKPKLYVSAFPKAGLHLLEQLVSPFVTAQQFGPFGLAAWVSTNEGVWTEQWSEAEKLCWCWASLRPGGYLKGHCAHRKDIAEFQRLLGLSHVMVYRDLRDVAVSVAHHVKSDDPSMLHPGKEMFKYVSFDEALEMVIVGIGPFPGIGRRWKAYHPWLAEEWAHCVKYEDILADPKAVAESIIEYGVQRTSDAAGMKVKLARQVRDALTTEMAEAAMRTDKSPTFRKGGSGGWKETFTARHKRLFKKHAGRWLVELGYEEDDKW